MWRGWTMLWCVIRVTGSIYLTPYTYAGMVQVKVEETTAWLARIATRDTRPIYLTPYTTTGSYLAPHKTSGGYLSHGVGNALHHLGYYFGYYPHSIPLYCISDSFPFYFSFDLMQWNPFVIWLKCNGIHLWFGFHSMLCNPFVIWGFSRRLLARRRRFRTRTKHWLPPSHAPLQVTLTLCRMS